MDPALELTLQLAEERIAILREIHEGFAGVSREGGVSWSEGDVIDGYGSDEDREAAREWDRDSSWQELLTDPEWKIFGGPWSFLDSIGFCYYLPAALVACLNSMQDEGIVSHLTIKEPIPGRPDIDWRAYSLDKWSLLNPRQRRLIKRFLRFMFTVWRQWELEDPVDPDDDQNSRPWREALDSYWDSVED